MGSLNVNTFALSSDCIIDNRYQIIRVIGLGGFSIIYEAYDRVLSAKVAVKEFFPSTIVERELGGPSVITRNKENKERFSAGLITFKEEAERMVSLKGRHNTVDVYSFCSDNNTCYIIMEYLEGQTLLSYIRSLPEGHFTNIDDAQQIIYSVAEALEYIHSKKIIHRDVSSDNIFLCSDGRVKLIDLGAARENSSDKDLSIVVKTGCTPPEQYRKRGKQGPWTDIYALGATFYMMLTGVYPDSAPDRIDSGDEYAVPSKINAQIPEYIDTLIQRCLAYDYKLRLSKASEIKTILERKITISTVSTVKKRKNALTAAVYTLAFICLALVALIGFIVYQKSNTSNIKGDISVLLPVGFTNSQGEKELLEDFKKIYPNVNITKKKLTSIDISINCDVICTYCAPSVKLLNLNSIDSGRKNNEVIIAYDAELVFINTLKANRLGKNLNADISSYSFADSYSAFISENNEFFAYRGSISEYKKIQNDLAPTYSIVVSQQVKWHPVGFGINSAIEDENRDAAYAFLTYLESERAQELLFINNSGFVPANKSQKDRFFKINDELEAIK